MEQNRSIPISPRDRRLEFLQASTRAESNSLNLINSLFSFSDFQVPTKIPVLRLVLLLLFCSLVEGLF